MILPGGVTLNFNLDEVTTRAHAPDGLRPPVTPLSAPDRVTLCGGLGIFMEHSAEPVGGIGKSMTSRLLPDQEPRRPPATGLPSRVAGTRLFNKFWVPRGSVCFQRAGSGLGSGFLRVPGVLFSS